MGVAIGGCEAPRRDVRIDLGRRQVLVTEQLLDDAQVGATVEEMRRERVPQRVRRDALGETGGAAQPIEPVAQAPDAEWSTSMVQEDGGRQRPGRGPPVDEQRPSEVEVR